MLVKIINVDVEQQTAKNGRAYEIAEVLYEADGKKQTKKIMSFSNPGVFKTLKDSKKGDTYEVSLQKDDKGYWQWTGMNAGGTVSADKPSSGSPTSQNTNRSFETKDERDARQRLIVRQSSLAQAIEYYKLQKETPNHMDVLSLADDFTDWVFEKVDLFDQPNDLPD